MINDMEIRGNIKIKTHSLINDFKNTDHTEGL